MSYPIKKILILAANPKNSTPLRLDQEVREINDALKLAKNRDQFEVIQQWAVRPRDMQRAVLETEPCIVHFSGHGMGEEGLALEDNNGQVKLVSTGALAAMFELCAEQVECVMLNACYSEVQADAIAQHIPYVVGMNEAVGDRAALEFAVGFYDALGAGRSIERAFKEGCLSIQMAGIPEHLIPVLRRKGEPETIAVSSPKPNVPIVPTQLDEPEGQIPLDSQFYVERPPNETRCYETIAKPGALIRIKAPRQMGKSSLMLRILHQAAERGHRATFLSFQSAGGEVFASLDRFLYWFCSRITRKLNLPDRLADYWLGALGSNDKCTDYFELYLLPEVNGVLTLGLDEVDEVFKYPTIASDFFGLLRAWHEEAKFNSVWRNLQLVITHSKEVYIPLNINQSPFNVGVPIDLLPLTEEQVQDLVGRHGLNWSNTAVGQLMTMMGGHPYLAQQSVTRSVISASPDELAGSIRSVNPGYPRPGRTDNCGNCVIATDATLSGRPASALPGDATPVKILEEYFGSKFVRVVSREAIEDALKASGSGSRAIIYGDRGMPGKVNHVFNAVNQKGTVRFLDGQTGKPADFTPYQGLYMMRTN